MVTTCMFCVTICLLTIPIPIIIGNFSRVTERSKENFYFNHEKTDEVKRLLEQLTRNKARTNIDPTLHNEADGPRKCAHGTRNGTSNGNRKCTEIPRSGVQDKAKTFDGENLSKTSVEDQVKGIIREMDLHTF